MLKVILFAFMEHGFVSTRQIAKLCKTYIRFMYLSYEQPASIHMTIDNFMNFCLSESIDKIFEEINRHVFDAECEGNRVVRTNEELTKIHKEDLNNLNNTKGVLLRMNRSIQAEGSFATIKWNREYKKTRRRGLKGVIFELSLISCGFNLNKYHLKQISGQNAM